MTSQFSWCHMKGTYWYFIGNGVSNDIKAVLLSDIIKYDVKDVTSYGHQTYMV